MRNALIRIRARTLVYHALVRTSDVKEMYSFKNIYTYVGHEISETENRMETKEKILPCVGYKLSVHL